MDKIIFKKVLIIDENETSNNNKNNILKNLVFFDRIYTYPDPKKALHSLQHDRDWKESGLPDIIFLEIGMSKMDGFDFLDEYEKLEPIMNSNYQPFIVIVSDCLLKNRNLDNTNKYKSIGVIDHIKKPMARQDVINLLEEHFREAFSYRLVI